MELKCTHCKNEYESHITKTDDKWKAKCPACGKTHEVNVDDKPIIMMFTDPNNDAKPLTDKTQYDTFTDSPNTKRIVNIWTFDTPEAFVEKWKEILDKPRGMWYWVIDKGACICSGACDPDDIEIFNEHWNLTA